MQIVLAALRSFQLLFAVVVIGLSANLIKDQFVANTVPSAISYAAFTGAFGLLAGLATLAALWVDAIQIVIVLALDALATIFYIAGGVVCSLPSISAYIGSKANVSARSFLSNLREYHAATAAIGTGIKWERMNC
jgi:hypothetical protein